MKKSHENQNDKMLNESKRKEMIESIRNAPLPKRGFQEFIKHDRTYLGALREEMEHKIVKLDILSSECQRADTETKEGTIKNIDLLCEFSSLKREVFDLKAKLFSIANLLTDKENHFNYVFLPQYEKEQIECNNKFKDSTSIIIKNAQSDYTDASSDKSKLHPGYRLIHSFSHALMRQLSIECGYGLTEISERIYFSEKYQMAGLLIYTASSDAEGFIEPAARSQRGLWFWIRCRCLSC